MRRRENLVCASPGCRFRVHSKPELGGYCCIACSEGGDHGPRCERASPPPGAQRADPSWWALDGEELAAKELEEALKASRLDAPALSQEDEDLQQAIRESMRESALEAARNGESDVFDVPELSDESSGDAGDTKESGADSDDDLPPLIPIPVPERSGSGSGGANAQKGSVDTQTVAGAQPEKPKPSDDK
mmetsp:Transcript_3902/g.10494  ORF Transcript_3902/g.10494 Transcript_3902/m.10494 type:complete len:189 (-) Transcript_3902:105-671(-)